MNAVEVTTEPTTSDTTEVSAPPSTSLELSQATHQTLELLRLINSTGLVSKAYRTLLNTLILRADPQVSGESIILKTTVTYAQLEKETMLCPRTVKQAARKLDDWGLISRGETGPRPNTYTINVRVIEATVEEGPW
jgi:hypothetical protein